MHQLLSLFFLKEHIWIVEDTYALFIFNNNLKIKHTTIHILQCKTIITIVFVLR